MLARIRSWWRGRSRAERFVFAVGVPVVAIAAVWGRLREGEDLEEDRAEDAEGGEGEAGLTPGSPGASIVNAGAGGVDAGGFAQYLEAFTSEISTIERRLDEFENDRADFGQNPNEPPDSGRRQGSGTDPERDGGAGDRSIGLFPMPNPPVKLEPSNGSGGDTQTSAALSKRARLLRDAPMSVTYRGVTYSRESGSLLYRSERSGAYLPGAERERVLAGV